MASRAFAVWITGLPASGKSTITQALREHLRARGIFAAVLESDALRPILLPEGGYGEEDRGEFYRRMTRLGGLLVEQKIPVIFDATANRRAYREAARREIAAFCEVYVDTPLEICMLRDPKGIYTQAGSGKASTVPGVQAPYEPPAAPDVTLQDPADAIRIVAKLAQRGFLQEGTP
jgi:adenylylsulfate kinase